MLLLATEHSLWKLGLDLQWTHGMDSEPPNLLSMCSLSALRQQPSASTSVTGTHCSIWSAHDLPFATLSLAGAGTFWMRGSIRYLYPKGRDILDWCKLGIMGGIMSSILAKFSQKSKVLWVVSRTLS